MELSERVDQIESRLRKLETDNSSTLATMEHFSKSIDVFIARLDKREDDDAKRFEKFEIEVSNNRKDFNTFSRYAWMIMGGLVVLQFLVANNIVDIGQDNKHQTTISK